MCRIAAYLGPPVRLSVLLHETPHGLTDQSRNARQMIRRGPCSGR
jgi:hypothetical protein